VISQASLSFKKCKPTKNVNFSHNIQSLGRTKLYHHRNTETREGKQVQNIEGVITLIIMKT
jgi:hypothetical protein